jgi:hypothetical protein
MFGKSLFFPVPSTDEPPPPIVWPDLTQPCDERPYVGRVKPRHNIMLGSRSFPAGATVYLDGELLARFCESLEDIPGEGPLPISRELPQATREVNVFGVSDLCAPGGFQQVRMDKLDRDHFGPFGYQPPISRNW